MTRMIEYEGIPCNVYTTSETTVAPGGPDLPNETVIYAAWRWLGHCNVLFHPLTTLCLAFRRGLVRGHTQQIEVSLPARAAHLPSDWSSPVRASGSSRWSFLPAPCWPACPAACGVWSFTEQKKPADATPAHILFPWKSRAKFNCMSFSKASERSALSFFVV